MNKEFKDLFYEKLLLSDLSFKEQSDFLTRITNYLSYGKTIEFVSEKLNKLLEFLYALDLNNGDVVRILTKYPGILDIVDDLYEKYLFLGNIENLDNSIRISKLLNSPKDYVMGFSKLYARYTLIKESGLNDYSWHTLVRLSDREFSRLFILKEKKKDYQIFDNELQVLDYLSRVDINRLDLSKLKEMTVNEELVRKYEGKGKRR